jgi:dihydroxyacetone kinase
MLQTMLAAEDELGRIDAVAGDGDHGVGMVRGLRAATAAAEKAGPTAGVEAVLRAAGAAWADKAGGTGGVLWGTILTAIGQTLGNTQAPTATAWSALSPPARTRCIVWASARQNHV